MLVSIDKGRTVDEKGNDCVEKETPMTEVNVKSRRQPAVPHAKDILVETDLRYQFG